MVKAPIYVLWDETIPSKFAGEVDSRIKKLVLDFGSEKVKIEYALRVIGADGYLKHSELDNNPVPTFPCGRNPLGPIPSDITSSLSRNLSPSDKDVDELPPLVLVVSNRNVSADIDISEAITRLLDNPSRPRLAVLGTSAAESWATGISPALESRKEFLTHLKSEDVSSIDASFAKIINYLHAKHNEIVSSTKVNALSSPTDSSVPKSSDTQVSKPQNFETKDEAARPVISIADSMEAPTLKVSDVQPSVSLLPIERAPVAKEDEAQVITDAVVESKQSSHGRKRSLKRGKSRNLSPRAKRRQIRRNKMANQVKPMSVVPSVPIETFVTPDDLRAIDGQLIVDVPSTLNAKHWFHPDWKKLPTQGPSRDLELDYGSLKKLRVMAGSTRGTKHQYYGNENQDAFQVGYTKSGSHLVVVVADGVSSAQFSAYGSRALSFLVSQSVINQIDSVPEGDSVNTKLIIDTAVRQASDRTQSWNVEELYGPPSPPNENSRYDVAATLCVAVIQTTQDELGSRPVVLACVGDSPCYTLNGAEWTLRSTATKDGVLLEQGTRALPVRLGEDPRLEWFEFDLSDSEVLVLMTDGIGTSLDNGNTAVGRWLAPRLYGPVLLEHFISTLTYDRQGEDDDRTLAIVYDFEGISSAITDRQITASEIQS